MSGSNKEYLRSQSGELEIFDGATTSAIASAFASAQSSLQTPVMQPRADSEDEQIFKSLRPVSFTDYIGQAAVKDNLLIACAAAKQRQEALDHVLLHGPPGLGKTSLAKIIAAELGVGFKATSGPVIERPGDLAAILTSLGEHEVLFIDEIHRLSRVVEEILYSAMEDYHLDILIGQGQGAKSIRIDLKPFTLVGATTRTSLLTSPLRDRFGVVLRLEFYTPAELTEIVQRSAKLLAVEIDQAAAGEIAQRSRGTPRIANRILKRVRDFAQGSSRQAISRSGDVRPVTVVSRELVVQALKLLRINSIGLDQMDLQILDTIANKFGGGPVGLSTLAAAISEDKNTIEDVYEPYLIQLGFMQRTARGREITTLGRSHLDEGSAS